MIRDQIMQMAESDPQFAQAVDAMEAQVARMPIVPEDLDEIIAMLEFIMQNPDKYPEVRQAAIEDGVISPDMVPEQYDQVFVVSLLVALYGLQDRLSQRGFSRGGLSVAGRRLQTGGRGGDSELVHVNPREAEMLRRMGGAGTINPNTGLREYKGGIGKILGAVAPIALSIIAPGIGTAIGMSLGATGAAAGMLGSAVIGGVSSALTGGNPLQGALMGGLGGGLGNVVGSTASNALGLGLGQTGQAMLGSGLVGGLSGLATGQGFGKGALQGVAGGAIGQLAGGMGGSTAFEQGIGAAGKAFGNALTSGYDPKTALMAGATAGLTTGFQGMNAKPSDAVIEGVKTGQPSSPSTVTLPDGTVAPAPGSSAVMPDGRPGIYQLNSSTGQISPVPSPGSYQINPTTGTVEWKVNEPSFWEKLTGQTNVPAATSGGAQQPGMGLGSKALMGASLMSALSPQTPPQASMAVQKMSPEQQEIFNRPSIQWDWERLQSDANAAGMSLNEYMAQNWPKMTSGVYNKPNAPQPKMAAGGALNMVARFARGAGTGRSDEIDAKLSDGEYVMDAETVAMLGDGSSKAGARKLDEMRRSIRSHKGKALAKGKFSPNAKSPLAYLKEVA